MPRKPSASPEVIAAALAEVDEGMSQAAAARKYGIPRSTLRQAIARAVHPSPAKVGRPPRPKPRPKRANVQPIRPVREDATELHLERADEDSHRAARMWLQGILPEVAAAQLGVGLGHYEQLRRRGVERMQGMRAADARAIRVLAATTHAQMVRQFGEAARAALDEGKVRDASAAARVVQESLTQLVRLTGEPATDEDEARGGPDIMAALQEATQLAPDLMAIENGATLGAASGDD